MTNINEMEMVVDFLTEKISELELEGTVTDVLRDFMRMTIDELKSQADRMARLEKSMAEMIKIEDEYYYVDAEGLKINAIETGNEIKVEETD